MKTIPFIVPLLIGLTHAAFAGNTLTERSGTLEEFSAVRFEKGSLVVVDRLDGAGYTASIGESNQPCELEDGARVRLPLGRLSFFHAGKQAVSFRPLEGGQRGFLVRKTLDDGRKDGQLRAVQFRLLIGDDGSLTYGPAQVMKENKPKVS